MAPAELSSINWEQDGEMSVQDTWTLVKTLTKVVEQDKASNLLYLSSQHIHSKRSNRRLIRPFPLARVLVVDGNVGEAVRSDSRCCQQRLEGVLLRVESPL